MHYFTAHRTALKVYSECDIVELTVNSSDGYRVTIVGYGATATFERGGGGWNVMMSAPGCRAQDGFLADVSYAKYIVMENGAALLAEYIVRQGIQRRSGRITPEMAVPGVRASRQIDRAQNPRRRLFGR